MVALVPLCLVVATVAFSQSPVLLVDHFNDDVQNRLGGYRDTFQRTPSTATAMRVADVFRGQSGRSLQIDADRQQDGFCGLWIHFFDFRQPAPTYFDCRQYPYLSFWVKGAAGGEHLLVKLADKRWIEKEDAVAVGGIEEFLSGGVTEDWQEVLIPLDRIGPLDRRNMGGLILEFTRLGEQTVYIDDVSFKTSRKSTTPLTAANAERAARQPYPRCLWVWSTDELLARQDRSQELLDFCQRWRITQLWMQLPYSTVPREPTPDVSAAGEAAGGMRCVIRHTEQLRSLLREGHRRGIQVHALDGSPEYCLRPHHRVPLAVVDAVIAFNEESPKEARWDGVHFDNEPYLLIGWAERTRREQILREYLELNEQCQQRIRAHRPLVFGVDIPFWWQDADAETGHALAEVEYGGVRKPASYHCIDMLDNVGVMNYRDRADGADGLIAHGRDLLAYADTVGRAKVYMGVETFGDLPTEVWFAVGVPKDAFRVAILEGRSDLASSSRLSGYRLQWFDDGRYVHIGLEVPRDRSVKKERAICKALEEIAGEFGGFACAEKGLDADAIGAYGRQAIMKDPSLAQYRGGPIRTFRTETGLSVFSTTGIMLPKITFADNSFDEFQRQVSVAEGYFQRYESYGGLAIHFYKTFRAKTQERHNGPAPIRE